MKLRASRSTDERRPHAVVERGRRLRPAQEEPLQQIRAQLERADRLGLGLDPLGDHQRADAPAQADQALQRLLLVEVVAHAADQAAVDLDHVRAKERDPIEVGVAGADVVEHDQEAEPAQLRGQRAEARDLLEARLEELDGHVARQQARGAHQRQQVGRDRLVARRRRQSRFRNSRSSSGRACSPEKPRIAVRRQTSSSSVAQSLGGGHLEQRLRRNDAAVGGDPARQRLHADHALLAHGEDRLKVSGDRLRCPACAGRNPGRTRSQPEPTRARETKWSASCVTSSSARDRYA